MRRLVSILAAVALVLPAWAQQKRVYISPDDHTDFFWTAGESTYRQAFLDTLDYYLAQADATAANPTEHQSRWSCDGSFWLWTYQKNKSALDFQKLVGRIASGHISVPLNPLCISPGGMPAEMVLRGMYYPGRIERQFGLPFKLVYSMENQSAPLGIASLWAGSGARYSWKGICNCDTLVPSAWDREHDIYHRRGLDGSGVMMKWNSMLGANTGMGGYAECRDPSATVEFVTTNAGSNGFAARYPYNVIGCFGKGWDDLQTQTTEFVTVAQSKTNATRKVIVSNELDYFADFEATYGLGSLPSEAVSYGNEWELYSAGLAEASSRVKRSLEKLRAAEALAALESLFDPTFMNGREAARDLAFMDWGLFFEHDFGMVQPPAGGAAVTARIAWQKRLASEIEAYVDDLYNDGLAALGARIAKGSGSNLRFFAFNPLGWVRSDYVDLPYSGATPFYVIDATTKRVVPSQLVTGGAGNRVRVLARDIPVLGYRVFELHTGTPNPVDLVNAAGVTGSTFENAYYKVSVAGDGALTSLIDKTQGNLEFAAQQGGLWLNDLGTGTGTVTVENAGPVSVTLLASSTQPVAHETRVTLYQGVQRVDIENRITQNFDAVQTWSFGFALTAPRLRHEEVGAVLTADLEGQGGHYSDRNARYDWLTLNHFADMAGGNGKGVTLSNADCYFFKLGNSTVSSLDKDTPRLRILAGGRVVNGDNGLTNQGGDSLFVQRFSLHPHSAYAPSSAMRFALEHQNPLVAGVATANVATLPSSSFATLSISDPDALLWAFKPAEEGIGSGLIARFWNVAGLTKNANVQLLPKPLASAWNTTHIETNLTPATVGVNGLAVTLTPQQLKTYRLIPAGP